MSLNFIKSKKALLLIDVAVIAVVILLPIVAARLLGGSGRECSFVENFGILCPGCGGTRCVYNFFNGRFVTAFRFNPYIFLSIIYVLCSALILNVKILLKNKAAEKVFSVMTDYRVVVVWAAGFMLFGILRNII